MRRTSLVLALAALFTGCGGATKTVTVRSSLPALQPFVQSVGVSPETSRVPEGAKGAARERSQFLDKTPPLSLTGSAIRLDHAGAKLIERFEEVQKSTYCPYWDAYGHVWTRGFGETDWSGNFGGRCISHATAEANLIYFADTKYLPAIRALGVNFTHHEVGALASFVWNLGPGIISGSIRSDLERRQFSSAWSIMVQYVHAGGVTLPGLVTRRHEERAYFFTPDPRPRPLTAAQRRALQTRIRVLHRVLGQYGCTRRRAHHQKLGPKCKRWFREGDRDHHALRVNHL